MEPRQVNTLRAALYLRVSTDEQAAFGYGLAYQEEKLRAFITSQEYRLDERHVYRDEGFSGTLPADERPALAALLEAAARREFEVVLVYRLDRFGRKILLILDGVQKLADCGVALRSVTEPFDTSNAFGRYLLASLGALAELERETIRDRTQGGRRMAAKAGKWVWGPPPYGYALDPQTKHLVLVPEETHWVHQFFTWVVQEHLPLTAVQRRANALRVPGYTKRPRKRPELHGYWHKKSLARIVSNPIYTGTADFYRFKRGTRGLTSWIDPTTQYDATQWITFTAPPIVSSTVFEQCQQQLAQNRAMAKRNLKYTYLFNKLVYCGHCGLKLFAGSKPPKKATQTVHRFYHGPRDPTWRRVIVENTRCHSCGEIAESRLEPIWETLKQLFEQPAYMVQQLRDQIQRPSTEPDAAKTLAVLEKQVDAVQRKQQRLNHVYVEQEAMAYPTYQQHLLACRREEQQLRREIATLTRQRRPHDIVEDQMTALMHLHEHITVNVHTVSYEDRSFIIHQLVHKITLHKEHNVADVELNLPDFNAVRHSSAAAVGGADEVLRDQRPPDGHTRPPPIIFRVPLADLTALRRELAHRNRWAKKRTVGLAARTQG